MHICIAFSILSFLHVNIWAVGDWREDEFLASFWRFLTKSLLGSYAVSPFSFVLLPTADRFIIWNNFSRKQSAVWTNKPLFGASQVTGAGGGGSSIAQLEMWNYSNKTGRTDNGVNSIFVLSDLAFSFIQSKGTPLKLKQMYLLSCRHHCRSHNCDFFSIAIVITVWYPRCSLYIVLSVSEVTCKWGASKRHLFLSDGPSLLDRCLTLWALPRTIHLGR